jgi:integrase
MPAKTLTAQAVAKMSAGDARREVPDAGCPGLYVVLNPGSERKSFALRYRRPDRRPAKLTLGTFNAHADAKGDAEPVIGGHLTLAAARRLAGALKHRVALGGDPAAEHRAAKASIAAASGDTFDAVAADFVIQHVRKKVRRWEEEAKRLGFIENADGELEMIERGLAARWRGRPLAEIDGDECFALIEEVRHKGVPGWARKNKSASEPRARAMHSTLSKMFGWAVGKRRAKSNPLKSLERPKPPEARERVLKGGEIVALWRATDGLAKPFGQLVKLLLLTGCRREEVAGMQVAELSDDGATWTIPGARTKNKKPHVVPLPPLAQSIIAEIEPAGRYVFSTTGTSPVSGFSKMKKRLDAEMKGVQPWVLHDLRRSCATGMAELRTAVEVVELCLNHLSGTRAGIVGNYNRSEKMDERKAALALWASHVEALVSGKPAAAIVDIKQGAKRARH